LKADHLASLVIIVADVDRDGSLARGSTRWPAHTLTSLTLRNRETVKGLMHQEEEIDYRLLLAYLSWLWRAGALAAAFFAGAGVFLVAAGAFLGAAALPVAPR
jgi:hypothetical protein